MNSIKLTAKERRIIAKVLKDNLTNEKYDYELLSVIINKTVKFLPLQHSKVLLRDKK